MASGQRGPAMLCHLCAAALILSSVTGMFIVERSSIRVLRPKHIKGRYESAIANFGIPNYGGTLRGVVLYPEKGSNGCSPFDGPQFKSRSGRPVILLLDRGDCYFALKAWNGQNSGAAAVLIADNMDEPLITMDTPEESKDDGYVEKIRIPSALINREFGMALKIAVEKGSEEVFVSLDWRESIPHPDERVEYEFWTNSNDECGARCDEQVNFVQNFKGHAQILERGGYTQFTPHYITWYCPEVFLGSKQCMSQCINHGRYCAPDPEQNFTDGYEGKDVVVENLRQLCVHKVANERNRSWVWWDYATDFHVRCSMKEKKYSQECADDVIKSLGMPLGDVKECMGDSEADVENPVLMKEQEVQDTFRGRVCQCPTVNGIQYQGDGYVSCKAVGPGRCAVDNGGCWSETKGSRTISACSEYELSGCRCPFGFHGNGYKCEDIDECKERLACQCDGCSCKNTWGGFDCKCKGNLLYIKGEDTCIDKNAPNFGWWLPLLILSCVVGAGIAGYIFYKYRLRSYMDSEIMAIMSQYMPLDNHHNEAQPLRQDSTI